MGAAYIELENFITLPRVEEAHRRAQLNCDRRNQAWAATGWRAAVARADKLLKVLEMSANIMAKEQDSQLGRTMRDPGATFGETKGTTEVQMWREAYRLMDEGNPIRNFEWIYGAAAWLCGYNL